MWGSIAVSTRAIKVSVESSYLSLGCAWLPPNAGWVPPAPIGRRCRWLRKPDGARRRRPTSAGRTGQARSALWRPGPSVRARAAGRSNGPRRGRAARSWPCRAREAGSRMRRSRPHPQRIDGRGRTVTANQPDRPAAESTMPARSSSASTRIRSMSRSRPAVFFPRSCGTSNISQACINRWSYATRFAS